MKSSLRLARAAGILEGEGTFALRANGTTAVIRCQMTDEDVILELQDLFGGRVYSATPQKEHHKPSWIWQLQGEKARQAMEEVLPYMFSRRAERIESVLLVANALHRKRQSREEGLTAAVEEYLQGDITQKDVAAKYGVSLGTVKRRLQSHGSVAQRLTRRF